MSFPGQDLFHGFHVGAGKVFMASALALFSSFFPGRSYDARFEAMVATFFSWCAVRRQQSRSLHSQAHPRNDQLEADY